MSLKLFFKNICILLFLLNQDFTFGQVNLNFDLIDINKGLSNNHISHLYEDSDGFIWISTEDGVNRYDGHQFVALRNSPININSVSANYIMNTTQNNKGDFIFGTYGEGFNILDLDRDTIYRFSKTSENSSFLGSVIRKIIVDHQDNLWILSDEGIHLKEQRKNTFEKIGIGNPWSRICMTADGDIWIVDDEKVYRYIEGTEKVEFQFSLPESTVSIQSVGNKIFYHSNKKGYVSDNNVIIKEVDLPDNIEITSEFIDGVGYFASDKRVFRYSIQTDTMEEVFGFNIGEGIVRSLLYDSKEQLWIGTTCGLLKENKIISEFKHKPISFNARRIIHKDSTIYLGGKNGIYILKNEEYKQLLSGKNITSLFLDKNKTIWAGDYKGDFYQIKNENSIIEHQISFTGINKSHIFGLLEDDSKRLWVGAWKGMFLVDKNGKILHFFRINQIYKSNNDKILQLFSDSKDRLWIATSAHGLFKIDNFSTFNPDEDLHKIKNYRYSTTGNNVLNSNVIFDIHEDKNGVIWIGTDAGLNKYTEESDNFNFVYNGNQLFDEKIMAIEHDGNNRLWISTISKGIFIYSQTNQSFTQIDSKDGLISNEFLFSSSTSDVSGTLYFGNNKGVQIINPLNINNELLFLKKPLITNINITGRRKNILKTITFPNKKTIQLFYPENDFSISFSALEYTNNSKINFAYKLEGLDNDWKFVKNNENTAYFTNIKKGTYTFRLKAFSTLSGFENGKETSLTIIVIPFWYNTNLAYVIYAILSCFLIFLIFYLILKQKNTQIRVVQLKNEESAKFKNIVSNFHYLGLTSIYSLNDLDAVKEDQVKIYSILSYFSTSLFDKNKVDEILKDITKNCISKLQLEDCVVYWINSNENTLEQKAAHGGKSKEESIVNPMSIPMGKGIVGSVAQKGLPELVGDLSKDDRYIVDNIPRFSELAVPIFINNQVVGVIDSEHSKKNFFTEGHLKIFQLIAKLLEKKLGQISNKNSINITNDNIYFTELKRLMEEEKLYRDPLLSLVSVANKLNISSGYLSKLINTLTEGNFNDFNNSYRVNDVKRMLKDIDYQNYSILSIGLEAGFNSKSVFYTTFKKHTGISPSEYRKSI